MKELSLVENNISKIIMEIRESSDAEFLKKTSDKVGVARRYAKIQKATEETYVSLLTIEIECLSKIASMGQLSVLPTQKKEAAIFFHAKSTEEIKSIINENPGLSAMTVYKKYKDMETYKNDIEKGRSIADGSFYSRDNEYIDEVSDSKKNEYKKDYIRNTATAISTLLDDYASRGRSFTIEEMADKVILEHFGEGKNKIDCGVERGIREICREAVYSSKTYFLSGKKIPKFVTCLVRKGKDETWARIPFNSATMHQFDDMIKLREEQIKQDKKSLENLLEIYNELSEVAKDNEINTKKEKIGKIMAIAEKYKDVKK